jgi:hypothetical protein
MVVVAQDVKGNQNQKKENYLPKHKYFLFSKKK